MSVPEVSVLEKVDCMKLADGSFLFRGGGVWIVLLPKVIPSEKDVSTISSLIVVCLYIYTLLGNFKIQNSNWHSHSKSKNGFQRW